MHSNKLGVVFSMFSISLDRLYDRIGDRTEVLGGGGDKTKQTKADDEPA